MKNKKLIFNWLTILFGLVSLFLFNSVVASPQYNYQYPTTRTTYYYTNLTNVTNIYNVGLNGTGSASQMCYFSDTDYVSGATGTSWDDTNKILSIIKDGYSFSFTNRYVRLMSASGEDSFLELGSDGNGGWSLVNRGSDYKAGLCSTSGGTFAFQCELEVDEYGNVTIKNNISANYYFGDGSQLTNLPQPSVPQQFKNTSNQILPNNNYPNTLNMSNGNITDVKHITSYIPNGQDGLKVYGRGSGGYVTSAMIGAYDSTINAKLVSLDGSYDTSSGYGGTVYMIGYRGSLGNFAGRSFGDFGFIDGNYTGSSDKRIIIVQGINYNSSGGSILRFNLRETPSAFKVPMELYSDGRVYLSHNNAGAGTLEKPRVIIGSYVDDNRSTLQVIGNANITTNLSVGKYIKTVPTTIISCNTNTEGAIYYNSTDRRHYGCNSSTWNALY